MLSLFCIVVKSISKVIIARTPAKRQGIFGKIMGKLNKSGGNFTDLIEAVKNINYLVI
jgi:hypothetical protein